MTVADLDRDLERHRDAADTVSANLIELDRDPHRQLLETAPLAGTSAHEWAEARTALASAWDWLARFTTFLDRATELRGSPRARLTPDHERQLLDFLTGRSIELDRHDVPLRDRSLLQQRQATTYCTADELLEMMSDAFARAREVVARVGAAWDELAPRIARARAAISDADAAAHPDVIRRLDALADALITDPLAVMSAAVDEVEASVAVLTRASAEAAALQARWPRRLRQARDDLAGAERAAAEARAARATTVAKILDPVLPDAPADDDALADELDHVIALADAGRWNDAFTSLQRWDIAIRQRCDAAASVAIASQAPMVERDQLRGLLDACRAKARRLELDEDDDVTAAYERAHRALHVAPADLATARRLVDSYRRRLTTDHEPEARR